LTPVPVELPLRPNEAAALSDLVFQHMEGRPPGDDARARLAARIAALELESIRPCTAALVRDPVHRNVYYMPVDGLSGPAPVPLLLHMTLASAPSSALFPRSLLVGRMRPAGGREVVVNAVPFGPSDAANIRTFAEQLDRAFLPRPQGAQPSIVVRERQPASALAVAFDGFRQVLKATGVNWACLAAPYEICLWAAIRAGWREGYSAAAERIPIQGDGRLGDIKDRIRDSAGCTRFTIDASPALGRPAEAIPSSWLLEEFAEPVQIADTVYGFAADEIARLNVKFGRGLELCEELFDFIRQTKTASGAGRSFDFALSLDRAGTAIAPKELIFCLHWLKARGRPAQLVAPGLNMDTLAELAAVARHFNATLSLEAPVRQEELEAIGRVVFGHVSLTVSLSESPDPLHIVRLASLMHG
jgi:hypothetical protein